jgi:DNA-binding transcriptional regulator LsrR (DeoR family)
MADHLDEAAEIESDELDSRVARELGVATQTVRKVRTKLKQDGLVRVYPTRNESGSVTCWHVAARSPRS